MLPERRELMYMSGNEAILFCGEWQKAITVRDIIAISAAFASHLSIVYSLGQILFSPYYLLPFSNRIHSVLSMVLIPPSSPIDNKILEVFWAACGGGCDGLGVGWTFVLLE